MFSDEEYRLIAAIVDRAVLAGIYDDIRAADRDICAAHRDIPLRLADLLDADRFNFSHDMRGIQRHLNRQTGKLENFFLPRYAV